MYRLILLLILCFCLGPSAEASFVTRGHKMQLVKNKNTKNPVTAAMAKKLADKEAIKVDLTTNVWQADLKNSIVSDKDEEWFRVSYPPLWKDGKPHEGGGFDFYVHKKNAEIVGPIWIP